MGGVVSERRRQWCVRSVGVAPARRKDSRPLRTSCTAQVCFTNGFSAWPHVRESKDPVLIWNKLSLSTYFIQIWSTITMRSSNKCPFIQNSAFITLVLLPQIKSHNPRAIGEHRYLWTLLNSLLFLLFCISCFVYQLIILLCF